MKVTDDRTKEQKQTHTWAVVGTDRFMSGWGLATGGVSYAAWACSSREELNEAGAEVSRRSDMMRVRVVTLKRYKPKGSGHLHIYVWKPGQKF